MNEKIRVDEAWNQVGKMQLLVWQERHKCARRRKLSWPRLPRLLDSPPREEGKVYTQLPLVHKGCCDGLAGWVWGLGGWLKRKGMHVSIWLVHVLQQKVTHVIKQLRVLSRVWLFAALWTVALQAPLSMGFPRQVCWSGLPFPPPGDLPNPGIEPMSLESPVLTGRFFTPSATWEA